MSSLKLTLVHPKELTAELFKSIRGSEMHAAMIRNRIDVFTDIKLASPFDHIIKEIQNWLQNSCKSPFHVSKGEAPPIPEGLRYCCTVYIEGETEAATFRLFMHDKEIEAPPPPRPAPPPPPSPPPHPSSGKPRRIVTDAWADIMKKRQWQDDDELEKRKLKKRESDLMRKISDMDRYKDYK